MTLAINSSDFDESITALDERIPNLHVIVCVINSCLVQKHKFVRLFKR